MQSRAYSQTSIFKNSQKLFDQVSLKIKATINHNRFFFAKSSNVDLVSSQHQNTDQYLIYQLQIQDHQQELIQRLQDTNKQIDIRFDVLDVHLLNYLKNNDCKVLHLTHNMFNAGDDGEHDTILVEGPNFEQNEVTPEEFKEML